MANKKKTSAIPYTGKIIIESQGEILIARFEGGPQALFNADMAKQLTALVDKADSDPNIHAVILTGNHPERFLSHADVNWLKEGGVGVPPLNTRLAGYVARLAKFFNKFSLTRWLGSKTKLKAILELDQLHTTLLKMNKSNTLFIAALNGHALAVGAEIAWACDLRIMSEGNYGIGLSEVLLGLVPGGGGSQRLARLIGPQKAMISILEGKPFSPIEALTIGAVDEIVPKEKVLERSIEKAKYFSLRAKQAVGATKRLMYFGGSLSLEEGLQVEHSEFIVLDQSKLGQERMQNYIDETNVSGDVPLLDAEKLNTALRTGKI